jgi:hypothetical protein
VAALPTMLAEDRRRSGWSIEQAAWRLGITVREYREPAERWPDRETYDRIAAAFASLAINAAGAAASLTQVGKQEPATASADGKRDGQRRVRALRIRRDTGSAYQNHA